MKRCQWREGGREGGRGGRDGERVGGREGGMERGMDEVARYSSKWLFWLVCGEPLCTYSVCTYMCSAHVRAVHSLQYVQCTRVSVSGRERVVGEIIKP